MAKDTVEPSEVLFNPDAVSPGSCGAYLQLPYIREDGTESATINTIVFCRGRIGHEGPHKSKYAPKEGKLKWTEWK
jgi:hypothetical protein